MDAKIGDNGSEELEKRAFQMAVDRVIGTETEDFGVLISGERHEVLTLADAIRAEAASLLELWDSERKSVLHTGVRPRGGNGETNW